jgi:hypothetical protein
VHHQAADAMFTSGIFIKIAGIAHICQSKKLLLKDTKFKIFKSKGLIPIQKAY